MAVNLSTYVGKSITDQAFAGLMQSLSPVTDFVVKGKGSELACSYSGWVITYGTGEIQVNGRTVEVDAQDTKTFPTPSGSGTAMVIAKVDLSTGTATIALKTGITLIQNNLISNPTGTREVELYRFTYTTSAITSFVDKRIITTMQEIITGLDNKYNTRIPVNSIVQQGVSTFLKLSSNQSLNNGVNATVALVKQVGDLNASAGIITLPAGFYYEIEFGLSNTTGSTTGATVSADIKKSDGAAIRHPLARNRHQRATLWHLLPIRHLLPQLRPGLLGFARARLGSLQRPPSPLPLQLLRRLALPRWQLRPRCAAHCRPWLQSAC